MKVAAATALIGDRMGGVLFDVQKERERQEGLRVQGKFPWTCAAPDVNAARKLSVLAEEFGEVAKEVTELLICEDTQFPGEDPGMVTDAKARTRKRLNAFIRKELVQVAAVAVAWCEALDEEEGGEEKGVAAATALKEDYRCANCHRSTVGEQTYGGFCSECEENEPEEKDHDLEIAPSPPRPIEIVEAPGDQCGGTRVKTFSGGPCPGCRACS